MISNHSMRPVILILMLFVAVISAADEPPYEATASYEAHTLHGFKVLVSARVREHPGPAADALKLLDEKLGEVESIVPAEPLAALRKTTVWVEWELVKNSAACAHHSPEWLKNNGRNPEKVGGVEISNVRLFLAWTPKTQPMMVLHELAHYYHRHQLPTETRRAIDDAYAAAKASGTYAEVEYVQGGKKPAYAMSNADEYFAELSEAYFGKNDFYPFVHDAVKQHDPKGFDVLQKAWGEPVNKLP
jgi:hypothetical protein